MAPDRSDVLKKSQALRQEVTRGVSVKSFEMTLEEALEFDRQYAVAALGGIYQEERIAG
jgi:hypothetical protein